ncbi:unnamed protein product [Ectocarpus sp. 6 AP-2014]
MKMQLLSLALPMLLLGVAVAGQSDDPSYLGCFSDPADSRVFDTQYSDSAMTAAVCSVLCASSAFYGTQYSSECWCGDNVDYDANGEGVCDMACSGDSSQTCGGFYAMSVYENPDDSGYLGCYSDPADRRIFELVATSDGMTSEICLGNCGAYQYYGTQYSTQASRLAYTRKEPSCLGSCRSCTPPFAALCTGAKPMHHSWGEVACARIVCRVHDNLYAKSRIDMVVTRFREDQRMGACSDHTCECWCGDNADYDANGEGVCDMACSGDASQICGGFYAMSVYENVDPVDPSYRGCYSDPADSRIFVEAGSSDGMTAEFCATLCSDSAFYGTQYSTQCWCGDLNARYPRTERSLRHAMLGRLR